MKKIGVILVLSILACLIILSSLAFALNVTENSSTAATPVSDDRAVTKAYDCLKSQVSGKNSCKDLSSEEQSFSLLALAYDPDSQTACRQALKDNGKEDTCWPASGCTLKSTALAVLALNYVRSDTKQAEEWLVAQNATPTDLIWYLQIDTKERSTCTINYDGTDRSVTVGDDKKLTSDAGGCLVRAQDDYWLKISSSCFNKKFIVSCDKDFVTNLLYKRQNAATIFVSSKTSTAPANGQTEETVNVRCFKQGSNCDYEGSMWAALALSRAGRDISDYLPYLTATAGDNDKFLPSAMLYVLTSEDLYLTDVISKLTPAKFWQVTDSPYNKYYDSALAIMSLSQSRAQELADSQSYFLSIAANNGCWPGIRDTAFLLFAGWPKAAANVPDQVSCSQSGYYCISRGDCTATTGTVLNNYYCPTLGSLCCSKPAIQLPCADKGGSTCSSDKVCSSSVISSSDTQQCCLGTCQVSTPQDNCPGKCKTGCDVSEETKAGTCSSPNVCCGPKSGGGSLLWLWLLIILVILGILAYIFREKLKEQWFKLKTKFSKQPSTSSQGMPPRPGMPPAGGLRLPQGQGFPQRGMPPRGFPPGQMPPRGMPPQPTQSKASEYDETIKKLKDMSK